MAVSIGDLQVLIEASVKAALAGQKSAAAGRLDERHFRRMDKLDGKNWKEFFFQFKTAVGSVNTTMRGYLDEIQKGGKDPDYDTIFVDDTDQDIERGAAEIYSILASMVTGEALVVLRGVPNGQGWEAWSRLFNRFDPRTPAKSLIGMMAVMTPKRVKDVRELTNVVEDWEVKAKNLKTEHDIDLDPRIKVALLTAMLPADLQDYVFQWSDGKSTYEEMRDRIISMAINRVSMSSLGGGQSGGWEQESQEQLEIGYVGESCRKCGGVGHYARECPTPKGKGKGAWKSDLQPHNKGKSKGKEKSDHGDFGKGKSKGKGKTFDGECWSCGERGHRSQDCQKGKSVTNIGSVEEEQETYVGRVWSIAHVEAEVVDAGWKVVKVASNKEGHQRGADHQRGARGEYIQASGSG